MEIPFHRPFPADLTLVETFRRAPDTGFLRLERHLARMARSAALFGLPFERRRIDAALDAAPRATAQRVRLTLDAAGPAVTFAPFTPTVGPWTVALSGERLDPGDGWLRHKTTQRARYDAARASMPPGLDEILFLNARGELCEGTITNVFADLGDGLLTPPVACGLLPGVLRETLLAEGRAREAVIRAADLARARLWVGNSLRGLIEARLAEA